MYHLYNTVDGGQAMGEELIDMQLNKWGMLHRMIHVMSFYCCWAKAHFLQRVFLSNERGQQPHVYNQVTALICPHFKNILSCEALALQRKKTDIEFDKNYVSFWYFGS